MKMLVYRWVMAKYQISYNTVLMSIQIQTPYIGCQWEYTLILLQGGVL
jgi:hypothetical protein